MTDEQMNRVTRKDAKKDEQSKKRNYLFLAIFGVVLVFAWPVCAVLSSGSRALLRRHHRCLCEWRSGETRAADQRHGG